MSEILVERVDGGRPKRSDKKGIFAELALAAVLVALGTFVFSESVETLDVKAEELGLEGFSLLPAPFPEYSVPGMEDPLMTFLLGLSSVVLVLVVAFMVGRFLSSTHRAGGVSSA